MSDLMLAWLSEATTNHISEIFSGNCWSMSIPASKDESLFPTWPQIIGGNGEGW